MPLSAVATAAVMPLADAGRVVAVTLVGLTPETGLKLLYTAALLVVVLALRGVARALIRRRLGARSPIRAASGRARAFRSSPPSC